MSRPAFVSELEQQTLESSWYRAALLKERLVAFTTTNANLSSLTEEQIQRGTRLLGQWKSQAAFQGSLLFTERLAIDSLTEQNLLYLLSEPLEQVQERITTANGIPHWLRELLHALEREKQSLVPQLSLKPEISQEPATFLQVFKPLITLEWTRLLQGIEELTTSARVLPFDPATVLDLFQKSLVQRLHKAALRAFVLEMHIARLEGCLSGETPQERFKDFLRQLSQPV